MLADVDLVVVGAGPAGAAAANLAARSGVSVLLLEAAPFPRFRPGETLCASAARLVAQLLGPGANADLLGLPYARIHRPGADTHRDDMHQPADGGVHIDRADLDTALLQAARAAGSRVLQPCLASSVDFADPGFCSVSTTRGSIRCRFVIDASGGTQWLTRRLGIASLPLSQPLRVDYQYWIAAVAPPEPVFTLHANGWSWRTGLPHGKVLSAALAFEGAAPQIRGAGLPMGKVRHAQCSWRVAGQLAAPRFAVAGDAAGHVDPASARGVLRAIASGMGAAQAAMARLGGGDQADALLSYCTAMTSWILEDCQRLHEAYRQVCKGDDPVGFLRMSTALFAQGEWHDTTRTR